MLKLRKILVLLTAIAVAVGLLSLASGWERATVAAQAAKGKAGEKKRKPAERPEWQELLDVAKFPIPYIKLRPIAEHIAANKLSDDFLIKTNETHDLSDEELWATSAMIQLMVRAAFEHHTESGLLLQYYHCGTTTPRRRHGNADMSCVYDHSNLVRINHVRLMLAMLRFGVSPSEPRMKLAHEQHLKQLDLVLAEWRKNKQPENISVDYTPRLLGLSLQLVYEWHQGRSGSGGGKVTRKNPFGLSKEVIRQVEELIEALDSLCVRGGDTIQGWSHKYEARPGNSAPYVTVTATVLEGLRAAQLMGFQVRDPKFLFGTIGKLVRYQSRSAYGEQVSFEIPVTRQAGTKEEKEATVTGIPRGWRWRMHWYDGAISRRKHFEPGQDDASSVCTAGGLSCLLLARAILNGAGLNPYRETEQKVYNKAVWDALAYLHRNLAFNLEDFHSAWDTHEIGSSSERGNTVVPTDFAALHNAMCQAGNLAIGDTPWYRSITQQMVKAWLSDQVAAAERIKSQHIEGGGTVDDPDLRRKLMLHWQDVSLSEPSERMRYAVMNHSASGNILLVLHGISFPPRATPEITGGDKPAEAPSAPDKPGGSKAPGE